MKTTLKFAVIAAAVAGSIGSAQALQLAPGTSTVAPTAAAVDESALGTLLDSIATTITTPTFSGLARSAVYDGPEAGKNLNFLYQFTSSTGDDAISFLTAGGFRNWTTDVFQNTGGFGSFENGTGNASFVSRGNRGGTVVFNMLPAGTGAGQSTNVFEVRTNATDYVRNWMGVIDSTGGFAPAFAPAIPEPETYALMLAGLGLLGFIGKRRMKNSPPADRPEGRQPA